ncbi:AAA family ATPase [Synechococcus sp. Cruz-9H2]|uniref:AAA family ATPase n=1 Tax=unclassified Synechococcus TaxID=2626047 RepID=UPI0020CD8B7C|nr:MULTISPECIES: AAA family ATPase [unclassified Synechococcus]MCP9818740.1 AAA family ATPase [Synechococcus sp. Cruz-9H2]MCP9842970.1 AAA family ATPase [Synechococcus sp. Edmonson 11F2]MCP9855995.1 AAA family ATPase [Synechococcus sp. Cruz-9C9]MCP9862118.1 AAA family ATPase [Synechococcus sp. Cruz-7E5]MCP9869389.1 AAA family ATPase [Synechococcus sp. Cruz-7B9]
MSEEWADQLDLLIRARAPILWIRSPEEERIAALLQRAAQRLGQRTLLRWDFVEGLQGLPNREGEATRNPMGALEAIDSLPPDQAAILLLLDFHRYCDDPGIGRRLRNLATSLRQKPRTLVITAPEWQVPRELEECLTILDLPLPDAAEISSLLESIARACGHPLSPGVLEQLTHCCSGLSEQRIRQVAARALARRGQLGEPDLAEVLEEKRQAIARSELLEYCPTEASPADIGGLEALKHWLEQRRLAFSDEAAAYGLPLPRGVLLVGPQGTGKSLTAKAIAHSWAMPLLRLDVGRLFAGLVGASEARTRDMIRRAEAMAPCVLWIDEIDKGFGGDSRSDGGTSQRVLASLLTWMAEKRSAVFVVATANGVESLPPELMRKGRFDEIFLLDLPDAAERRTILDLQLRRRRPDHRIPLEVLVDRTAGFSGAELEQTVVEAMHLAFAVHREFGEADLIAAASDLVPLSRTAREQLDALKQWASSGRARPASRLLR